MREKTRTYRLLVVIKGMNSYAARHDKARLKSKSVCRQKCMRKVKQRWFKFKTRNKTKGRLSAIISIPPFVRPK